MNVRTRAMMKQTYRAALRGLIAPFASWTPLEQPEPGYTVIIGCNWPLAKVLLANLECINRQKRDHLKEIIVVFDRPADRIPVPIEQLTRQRFPSLPIRFIYYPSLTAKFFETIDWGWTYAWLSWSKGIAASKTRWVMLHDFDAMLLRTDILEERYALVTQEDVQWCGTRWYGGTGREQTVTTFEMMLDAQFVRNSYRPVDLFNNLKWVGNELIDFDTTLYAQTLGGKKSVHPIELEDMVHPSQTICQFTYLKSNAKYIGPEMNNLPMIPYMLHMGGDEKALETAVQGLAASNGMSFELFNRTVRLDRITDAHRQWIRKQVLRLEEFVSGDTRPLVEQYVSLLARDASSSVRPVARSA